MDWLKILADLNYLHQTHGAAFRFCPTKNFLDKETRSDTSSWILEPCLTRPVQNGVFVFNPGF